MKSINENLVKLMIDVSMIKRKLMLEKDPEGELSNWAEKQLEEARRSRVKVSHEEVKRQILGK